MGWSCGRKKNPRFSTNPVTSQILTFPICQMGLILFPSLPGVPVRTKVVVESNCQICHVGIREACIMLQAHKALQVAAPPPGKGSPTEERRFTLPSQPGWRAARLLLSLQQALRCIPPKFSPLPPRSMAPPSPARAGDSCHRTQGSTALSTKRPREARDPC